MNTGRFGGSGRSAKPPDLAWHARGQGFKSPQLHHPKSPVFTGDFVVSGGLSECARRLQPHSNPTERFVEGVGCGLVAAGTRQY